IFTKSRLRIKIIADVPDSRRRDLDNILKSLLDSLIYAGFAEDDEQFDDIRVIRGVKVPGGRLGIKITELENA
ncbi:TPA: RusA family crossover junction endodeoxyribonuclease, partial [Escherichia coli]|nr:RusA family crossover junction endodeoxyribonuclease [Escherichia coli]